jgi:serine/threonine protein phosphatase Stp1
VGDCLLLCSDGLYRELQRADLAALLEADDPGVSAGRLLDRCLDGAARDNVSLVVVRAREPWRARGLMRLAR